MLQYASCVIATGATARIPDIPGIKSVPYMTNATFFNQTRLPEHLLVIGSGPIGTVVNVSCHDAIVFMSAALNCLCKGEDSESRIHRGCPGCLFGWTAAEMICST